MPKLSPEEIFLKLFFINSKSHPAAYDKLKRLLPGLFTGGQQPDNNSGDSDDNKIPLHDAAAKSA